jgi:hypothetical protein
VPSSFLWGGRDVLVATPAASPTGRNLWATGRVWLGIGPTRGLVLTEGTVVQVPVAREIPDQVGDAFPAKTGFDPRQLPARTCTLGLRRGGCRPDARPTSWPGIAHAR